MTNRLKSRPKAHIISNDWFRHTSFKPTPLEIKLGYPPSYITFSHYSIRKFFARVIRVGAQEARGKKRKETLYKNKLVLSYSMCLEQRSSTCETAPRTVTKAGGLFSYPKLNAENLKLAFRQNVEMDFVALKLYKPHVNTTP